MGGNSRTYFFYDGDDPVCEMDGAGNITAGSDFGADGVWARHVIGDQWLYTFDAQGCLSQALNPDGSVRVSAIFDAQGGEQLSGPMPPDPYGGFGGQWGYRTDWQASYPSSLVLCGHRFYDFNSGRFLTRDSIGYGGGVNLYAYCRNNPVTSSDSSGYMPRAWGGCSAKDKAELTKAIRLACQKIREKKPGDGYPCPGKEGLDCLKRLCNSNISIFREGGNCDSNSKEWGETPSLGSPGQPPSDCYILICMHNQNVAAESGNEDPGINTETGQIAKTIIHEMMHCCGRHDNNGPPLPGTGGGPSNPADAGARCCMGLGPPYRGGYGH